MPRRSDLTGQIHNNQLLTFLQLVQKKSSNIIWHPVFKEMNKKIGQGSFTACVQQTNSQTNPVIFEIQCFHISSQGVNIIHEI